MVKCLKDTGFRWPQKPPNASEVKFNILYMKLHRKSKKRYNKM